jgi:hypothetical protein
MTRRLGVAPELLRVALASDLDASAENAALLVAIGEIHEQSPTNLRSPRVRRQLRRHGIRVSRHRVARLMARHARRSAWSPELAQGRHPKVVPAPDLLHRDFTAARSDLRWVAAIRSALGRGYHRVRLRRQQAIPRRDPRPARPQHRRLVHG